MLTLPFPQSTLSTLPPPPSSSLSDQLESAYSLLTNRICFALSSVSISCLLLVERSLLPFLMVTGATVSYWIVAFQCCRLNINHSTVESMCAFVFVFLGRCVNKVKGGEPLNRELVRPSMTTFALFSYTSFYYYCLPWT
jgi:hypothetical protein